MAETKTRVRVVVTGIGVVTPIGIGKDEFWKALEEKRSGIVPLADLIDLSGIEAKMGAPVKNLSLSEIMIMSDDGKIKRLTKEPRAIQLGVAAAALALKDSGLKLEKDRNAIGVIGGVGAGSIEVIIENQQRLAESPRKVSVFMVPQFMPNALAAEIAIFWGLKAVNFGLVSACASSSHAIGVAADLIRLGYAKLMLAGGADAPLLRITFAGFDRMKALSRNQDPLYACRPFDLKREGFVPGEGAAFLLLESLEHAYRRGAHIYAEIPSCGMTCDAFHITAPDEDGDGAARAMQMALDRGEIKPQEVGYINAHGTSTELNDKTEALAIHKVFGEYARKIPVSSTKSYIGHLLGAAGAAEAAATLMALEKGIIHPTLGLKDPDPQCDLWLPQEPLKANVKVALSNSFGFGGHNASLAFRKVE